MGGTTRAAGAIIYNVEIIEEGASSDDEMKTSIHLPDQGGCIFFFLGHTVEKVLRLKT